MSSTRRRAVAVEGVKVTPETVSTYAAQCGRA